MVSFEAHVNSMCKQRHVICKMSNLERSLHYKHKVVTFNNIIKSVPIFEFAATVHFVLATIKKIFSTVKSFEFSVM